MFENFDNLLDSNKAWAKSINDKDPDFFKKLSQGQSPKFLWIGCADSRVPPDKVTGTQPGEIFIHRNIANVVVHTDLNLLSVLQYAVEVLKVEHILLVGHYGCGGVQAAIDNKDLGIINNWLRHIKDVYIKYEYKLKNLSKDDKFKAMVEYNVIEQTKNIIKTTIVQKAWQNGQKTQVHGCVYDLADGLMKELLRVEAGNVGDIEEVFRIQY